MTTSSTVSAPSARSSLVARSAPEQRPGLQRRCSVPKITGRKLRTPRKFVVTDVPDDELDVLAPCGAVIDELDQPRDFDDQNNNDNNNNDEFVSSSSVRKGKTRVKGRFTITDLSPESPEARDDLSVLICPTSSRTVEAPRRQPSRKLSGRKPFQSAGDVRSSLGLTKTRLSQQQQPDVPSFASFQSTMTSSATTSRSARPTRSINNQTSHSNNQSRPIFDYQLEFLEKETHEMKSVLEKMVATNAQWIETLASAALVHANSPSQLSETSLSEPVVPVELSLERKYREIEKAYTDLQATNEALSLQNERMEVKNAMLEIRLQQQINRSSMLRSQLDKLTLYTEKLIGESSEPTLHDYSSDLNSIFGEQSEANSPTADGIMGEVEYGFNYDIVKSQRRRWHGVDEECMSDTSTEGESIRRNSSCPPFEPYEDNNRYMSDAELGTNNNQDSSSAIDFVLADQCNQLRQSLRSNSKDAEDDIAAIDTMDSMVVSIKNDFDGDNQIGHSGPMSSTLKKSNLLIPTSSVGSLNQLTVSSTSSLAGYGLHLATMAQSKCYCASVAATSLFGPHPEPYPNASNQQYVFRDEEAAYNVLSPENLRFHDCQSLLQAAEGRGNTQKTTTRRGFPFTKSASLPGTIEAPTRSHSTGSLFQRFSVQR